MSSEMVTQVKRPIKLKNASNPVILRASSTAITDGVTATTDPAGSIGFDTATPKISVSDGSLYQALAVAAQAVATTSTPTFVSETLTGAAGLTLGVDSTTASKVKLFNATSGSISVAPATGALGTVTLTLPAATDTLVGKNTTDTLTNKTLTSPIVNNPTGTELSESVVATNVITAAESGTTFYLNAIGGFTSTLPAPALGLYFKFVVKTAPTTAYIITTNGGANVLFGQVVERAGGAGVAGASQDTINFVANQAIIADWYEFRSDDTNWYVHGMVNVSTATTFAVT